MNKILKGKIRTTSKGVGYFRSDEIDNFVEIPADKLNTALDLDLVRIKINGKNKFGDFEGEVLEVLERDKKIWVGTVRRVFNEKIRKKVMTFIPDNRRFYPESRFENLESFPRLKENYKVLVELVKFDNWRSPALLKIKKVLGKAGEHETEMKAAVYDRGLVMGFPKEIEEEAEKIKKKSAEMIEADLPNRKDLRDLDVFTIDPHDAKDFDDAISIEFLEDGNYRVGVHIADPTFFVKEGSLIDKEAYNRATSIYLVDRTIPMLPEVLSNDLCSLNPNEDKMAFSLIFVMNKEAEVLDEWFGPTIINSKRRFNYLEAQKIIDENKGDYLKELKTLSELAKKMEEKRVKAGSIQFNSFEIKFKLDEKKFPTEVYIKPHVKTMDLIEEFALLANKRISKKIASTNGQRNQNPFIFRVHEKPKEEKVMEVISFLNKMGKNPDLNKDGLLSAKEMNKILKESKGTPEEDILSLNILRSMQKAVYHSEAKGHFGLAFDYYSHFTSPIRRYPDMIAHRLVKKYLKGEKVSPKEIQKIQKAAEHSSEMEQRAISAERDSIAFKLAQYYSVRIGEDFFGIITGVAKFGVFVENLKTKAQGLVSVRNMGNDFFVFDEKEQILKGEKSKKTFKLGDKIKTKVLAVNIDERKIDLELKE